MMSRREAVPFAFVAEAERFRSNVTPPPKQRLSRAQFMSRALVALAVAAGLAGSLLFGLPSLQTNPAPHTQQVAASHGR
jgi:hypothetical protein